MKNEQLGEKFTLYLGGGMLAGIFGGGVVTALEELNAFKHIREIRACSAGAFNAAYALAGQSRLGASIYYDDLTTGFIMSRNFFPGLLQRFWHRFIFRLKPESIMDVINVDRVMEIIRITKALDIERIFERNIPLYIKVLNAVTGKSAYILATPENLIELLRATMSLVPYCAKGGVIDGVEYIDGTIADPINLTGLLNSSPGNLILVVNYRLDRKFTHFLKAGAEGIVASWMYDIPLFRFYLQREGRIRQDLSQATQDPRVILIAPPPDNPTWSHTTQKENLLRTYQLGIDSGKNCVRRPLIALFNACVDMGIADAKEFLRTYRPS